MAWGLSRTGFKRPNQAELKTEIDQRQKELFGENVNLSSKSPNGILSGILSWSISLLWQVIERVYHNGHVSSAEGVSLDYKTIEFNTSRNPEQYAEGQVVITGTPNFTVLAGTRYEKETGVDYAVKENVTLDGTGKGIAEVVSLSPGIVGNADPDTVIVQSEPNSSVLSITNPNSIDGGREQETDEELRNRLFKLGASNGSGTTNAILSDVLGLPGVRAANIIVNREDVPVNGQPPHSNHVFVLGGVGEVIAETLFKNYVGLQFFGSTDYIVKDIAGNPHTIAYTPATPTRIYITVKLTTDATFETNGIDQVKTAIVKLIGGLAVDGTEYTGLSMADDVVYSKIIAAVMSVKGVTDATIKLGTSINPTGTANIPMDLGQVAQINHTDIVVTL